MVQLWEGTNYTLANNKYKKMINYNPTTKYQSDKCLHVSENLK